MLKDYKDSYKKIIKKIKDTKNIQSFYIINYSKKEISNSKVRLY